MSNPDQPVDPRKRKLDEQLGPIADDVAAGIIALGTMLVELELIDEENPGTPRWHVDLGTGVQVIGIEADHPDGPRLYSGMDVDTIIATRMRSDGRYEHAVIDESGMPIEWRTAYRPDLN